MNDYERNRGHPCDSEEWFFKILGAPEYRYAWCAKKEVDTMETPVNDDGLWDYLEDEYEFEES